MSIIAANLQAVTRRIDAAPRRPFPGQTATVCLVAISKTQPQEKIREAYNAGQRVFGENYVQEALAKMPLLADLAIEWHFVGPIQSNKTKALAGHFAWVHGVDRAKVAQALSRYRGGAGNPLNICIQVNISGEVSKSGILPDQALALAREIAALPNLRLRGLMTIIENTHDPLVQRAQFRKMRELAESIIASGIMLDTLSMGMTQDFEVALEEGATMVRIGEAIFGARRPRS